MKDSVYNMGGLYTKRNYQFEYDRATNRRFDNSKVYEVTGGVPEGIKQTVEGISMCCEKFLYKLEFGKINWRDQALIDRAVKERASLKEINGNGDRWIYMLYRYTYLFKIRQIVKRVIGYARKLM